MARHHSGESVNKLVCGIVGFISAEEHPIRERLLRRMMDAVAHRGPDGRGEFHCATGRQGVGLSLGHLRLAIIDLSTGDQPLTLRDRGLTIVYNGEVYNYIELRQELKAHGIIFRTTSDTEVLLQAYAVWGPDCLPRLRGMFAFVIWDALRRELFLARDPFGKKPLFYLQKSGCLAFASEVAALAEHPAFDGTINLAAMAQYLVWHYVPGADTMVCGVRHLPPGHFALWSGGELEERRYFSVPRPTTKRATRALSPEDVAGFRNSLSEAVRIRMRSDVPVGAFLSGGIDSSSIVALMARETPHALKTYSIGFEDERYSELWAARLVAEKYRTDHHEIIISPQSFLRNFEEVSAKRGTPLTEMADIPLYLMSVKAAREVKVVLSGEGSDELLAGYPKHWGDLYVQRLQSILPQTMASWCLDILLSRLPYSQRRLAVLLRAARERDFVRRQAAWFGLMSVARAAAFCPALFNHYEPFVWRDDPGPVVGTIHRALTFDKTVWLPGTLLDRGDRITMAASLEARMPFMDVELCRFVATLPASAFLKRRVGKQILRKAMAEDLPAKILSKPKVGFRIPVHEWIRCELQGYVRDMLLGSASQFSLYCDKQRVEALINDHIALRRNNEKEIWSFLALELFLRQLKQKTARRVTSLA